jgi:hypothetical protein
MKPHSHFELMTKLPDSPCLELDDAKSKERSKEEIAQLQEVTRPDVCRMVGMCQN